MKNKKGISIGRILLYVLFLSLIGLFVWTLYLTYKATRKKEETPVSQINSSLRYAYNNQFDYSAADYFGDCYINFYKTNDIAYQYLNGGFIVDLASINTDILNSTAKVATFSTSSNGSYVPYYLSTSFFIDDNSFNFGGLISSMYSTITTLPNFNMFTYPNFSQASKGSACMIINCDIPLELWQGTCSGYYYNSESWLVGDDNNVYRYNGGSNFGNFNYNSLPSAMRSNCSRIKKIILPVWQSASSNGLGYYFLYSPYNYNYQSVITNYNNPFVINFNFTVFTQDTDYQDGYNDGYNQGVLNADNALREQVNDLINANNSLNSSVSDLQSQVQQQQIIINELNTQLQAQTNNFKGLFFTMADIPFKTVSNALGFEFWGVNLFRFFVGIITALGILWLIKRLYK